MELDFSKLDGITGTEPLGGIEVEPPEEDYGALFARVKAEREPHKRANMAYKRYQENIKKSEQIQTELLKGVQAGEAPEELLLKACKAISLMTGNTAFYTQIEKDANSAYKDL